MSQMGLANRARRPWRSVGPHDVQFDSPQDNDDGLELDDEDEQFLGVVRCILTKPTSEDWRRTANYTTYMKCGQAFYRVIIDSGSAINAVSSKPVSQLKLTPPPHHCPYKVSCVNKTSLPVTQHCLLPLEVLSYKDNIWWDVIPMDVGHIILGRPWLYDNDVTTYGHSNIWSFKFNGKTITLKPLRAYPFWYHSNPIVKQLQIISPEFRKEVASESLIYALVTQETIPNTHDESTEEAKSVLADFQDAFSDDLHNQSPPMCDIQHVVDLVLGATLPNLLHYRLNPTKHAELKRQIDGLLQNSFVKVLALVLSLHYWLLKRMVLGECVLIVEPPIKSLSSKGFLFPVLMICWIWRLVPPFSLKD